MDSNWVSKMKRLLLGKEKRRRREGKLGTILRSKHKEIIRVQEWIRGAQVCIHRTSVSKIARHKFQSSAEINETINKSSSRSIPVL